MKSDIKKTALLISTYNWAEALELTLKSILIQTETVDEILIADDGSTNTTRKIINTYKNKIATPIHHFWHEDKGFRKAVILNKAIAASTCDYIIQVDGDCFLHKNFIEDHKKYAEKNLYLYGTRVRIKEKYVKNVLKNKNIHFSFFSKQIKKRPRILRFPILASLFKKQTAISGKFRGCNTSFWKSDFIKINGYNEDFKGWGREDSELMLRFHNIGVNAKRLKFVGIVFHLDHKENSQELLPKNDEIQSYTIKNKLKKTKNGVSKYFLQ